MELTFVRAVVTSQTAMASNQTNTRTTPQAVMANQQKAAIARLANQGTPNQVRGWTPVIQNKATP